MLCPTHATYPTYASTAIIAAVLSLGAIAVLGKSYGLALGCCVQRAGDGGSKTVFLAPPAHADVVYDLAGGAGARHGDDDKPADTMLDSDTMLDYEDAGTAGQVCAQHAGVVYTSTNSTPASHVGAAALPVRHMSNAVLHVRKRSEDEEPPSKKTQSPLPMKPHTAIPTGINNQKQTQTSGPSIFTMCLQCSILYIYIYILFYLLKTQKPVPKIVVM